MTSPQLPPLTVDGLIESRRRYRQEQDAIRYQRMQSVFKVAVTSNAAAMAEAQEIAKKLGQPPDAIEDNIEVAREMSKVYDLQQARTEFPSLDKRLDKLEFAGLAHDDLGNIKMVESTLDWIKRHAYRGVLVNERGEIGWRMRSRSDSADDARRLQEIDRQLSDAPDDGIVASALELGGQMVGPMAKSFAAGATAAGVASAASGPGAVVTAPTAFTWGFLAASFAQSARLEGGNAFADMIAKGYSRDAAELGSGLVGLANGLLEVVGVGIVTNPIRKAIMRRAAARLGAELIRPTTSAALKTLATEYVQSIFGEASTEAVQELVGVIAEEGARRATDPSLPAATPEEIVARVTEAFTKTAKGMTLLGLPGPALHYISDTNAVVEAKEQMRFLRSMRKGSEESKVRQKSPAAWAEHLRAQTKGTPVENVYINGNAFAETLQQMQHSRDNAEDGDVGARPIEAELDQLLPGTTEKIKAAVSEGPDADVVLPLADVEAKLAGTEIGERLLEHSRVVPEARSFAEAREIEKDLEAQQAEAQKILDESQDTNKAFVESAHKVESMLAEQIKAADPKATPDQVRAEAVFYRNTVVNFAAELGVTPEEFYARYPYRVVGEGAVQAAGTEFDQQGVRRTDTPEFAAWFGDSKVVDAEGKPLVVYHGTNIAFEEFDANRVGSSTDRGKLGVGFYFTEDPRIASSYATLARAKRGMSGAQVYPVHLALRNPLVLTTESGDVWSKLREVSKRLGVSEDPVTDQESNTPNAEWAAPFTAALRANGYDGVTLDFGEGRREHVVFEPTQIKSVNNRGTYDPNDPNILHARGAEGPKGKFDPKALTTVLMQKADTSTFLHETAHYYLTVLADLASSPDAPPRMQADMQTLLDWFGVADVQAWNALSLEQQRKHHEAFAYNFETYMFEGKAPTRELKTLFDKFAAWLRNVYKSIRDELNAVFRSEFGEDLPILTGEVRTVMDRMVATEEAVTAETERRGMLPFFLTQEEAGMSDEEWAAYQQLDRERKDDAIAEATRADLRNLSWLDGFEGRLVKAAQKENAEVRKRVRAEVAAEVLKNPRDRAQRWIRDGVVVKDDGTTEKTTDPHKLDRAAVEALLPAGTDLSKIDRMLVKSGGLNPDAVAEVFGFPSGRAMVNALIEMRPFDEVVDAITDQRMLAENAELVPGTPEYRERINLAIHNEAHARFVATELRFLQNSTKPVRQMVAAAKEAALRVLDKTPVAQVDPKKFLAAETRINQQLQQAQKKGDREAVIALKRRQLLHSQLVLQSYAAREEITKARRALAPIWRPDAKVAKQRNLDLVLAARWVMAQFGLATEARTRAANAALARVREHTPDALAEFEPILADAALRGKPLEELTLQEFRDMTNLVQWLWQRSKRDQEIEVDGKKVLRKEAIAEMVEAMRKIHGDVKLKGITTDADRRALTFANTWAKLKRVEAWARQMDGGTAGPVTRYLWRSLRERYDSYMDERERLLVKVRDDLKKLTLNPAKIDAPELEGAPVFNGTAELLGAMQHAGNSSNLRRLLLGYGWAAPAPNGGFVRTGWDAFVARMMRDGILTKEHFDYLQSVWDLNENELRPLAQKVNREVYGLFFEQIPAEPIETPWGTYRGGYMPAKPDPAHPGNADIKQRAGLDAIQQMEVEARSMLSAGRSFTLTRAADVRRPLLLDIRLQVQHLDEVLRFIYMQPALKDVASILKDQDFAGYLNGVDPAAIKSMLLPWLEDVATNRVTKPSTMPALDKFFGFLRRSTGLNFMFGSLRNATQQLTGLTNVLNYVKARHVKNGLMRYYTTPGITKWVTERSKAMRVRLENQVGQIQEDIDLLLDPSWMGNLGRWTNKYGYFAQRFFQGQVDVVAWLAAYQQELEKLGATETDEAAVKQAIAEADSVVRLSQGSVTPADTAAYERSSAFARLFTQFSSYFNSVLNQIAAAPEGTKARAAMVSLVLPALGAATIAAVASGGDEFDDKDGNGYSDEVVAWLFATQARAAAGLVPGFGPLLAQAASGDRRVGDRLQPAPAWSAVQAFARSVSNLTGGEPRLRGREITDLFQVFSVATGVPLGGVGRSLGYYADVEQGRVVPRDGFDYARGVFSGRASAGTRQ